MMNLKNIVPLTIKQFIKNLTLKNLKYIIKGYYLKFIQQQYAKHFDKQNVMNMIYKGGLCSDCCKSGIMECCGCSFYEAVISGKSCKYGKF